LETSSIAGIVISADELCILKLIPERVEGMVRCFRESQYAKAFFPIDVTLFGINTLNRFLHPSKAEFPIEVTLFGITKLPVKPEQPSNVLVLIEVKEEGMVSVPLKLLQP
jgi:hypothetical protein